MRVIITVEVTVPAESYTAEWTPERIAREVENMIEHNSAEWSASATVAE